MNFPLNSPCPLDGAPATLSTTEGWEPISALGGAYSGQWEGAPLQVQVTLASVVCLANFAEASVPAAALVGIDDHIELRIDGAMRQWDTGEVRVDLSRSGSPAEWRTWWPGLDIDLTSFEYVTLELEVELHPARPEVTLAMVGHRDDCQPMCDETGCGGCPPFTEVPLRSAVLAPVEE